MANIKQAFEYAAQNPDSEFATNLKQLAASGSLNQEAEKYGIDLSAFQPKKTFSNKVGEEVSRLNTQYRQNKTDAEVRQARGEQTGLETAAQTFGEAARASVGTALSPLTVGVGEILNATGVAKGMEEKAKATEAYIAEQKALNPNYDPKTDTKLNPYTAGQVQAARDMGIPEYNPSEREKANLGIATNLGGAAIDVAGALEGAGALKAVAGATGKAVATGAKRTASTIANAPIVSGTGEVLKSAGRTLKTIPENIATNVGEMQAKEALIKSIPSAAGQKAARAGIDVADAVTLQNAIQTPEARTLIDTIKNFATGQSKTSPFEVVGKPIVTRLKTLDEQVKNFASQLDTVAQSLKGQAVNDTRKIQDAVADGISRLQIGFTDEGLDFAGSTLEGIGNSGKIVDNVYRRIQTADDAFALHNLKKYIDANVSYGKRVEGLDAGAERLLKSWRKAIDDTLDTQFANYNRVNTELTKRISPLEDLKGILKNTDGLDTDLLSQKAGIIARRITSAAASNPEIKQVLRNLDKFTSAKGETLGKIENLQDLYNVLNKYYDIAPKTGFQNLVKEGASGATGLVDRSMEAIKGFAGGTNATRQKALENYLDELLNPAKLKTNPTAKNSTKATTKNVIMSDTIPQKVKGASKSVEKSISKELQPLAEEAKKYKSAEEFVKAQSSLFRGVESRPAANRIRQGATPEYTGVAFSREKSSAQKYGDLLMNKYIPESMILKPSDVTPRTLKMLRGDFNKLPVGDADSVPTEILISRVMSQAKQKGKAGADIAKFFPKMKEEKEVRLFGNVDVTYSKSQLIDLWNKANGKN